MLKTLDEVVAILKSASAENILSAYRAYSYYLHFQGNNSCFDQVLDLEQDSIKDLFYHDVVGLWNQIKNGSIKTDCRYIAEWRGQTRTFCSYKSLDEFVDYQALAKWLISEAPFVMEWAYPYERSVGSDAPYRYNNAAVTLFLVLIGADVNVHDFQYDLLTRCIENEWAETAKAIIEKGAALSGYVPDTDYWKHDASSPLLSAVDKGNVEIVKLLLEKGADPNAGIFGKRQQAQTYPLLFAAEKGELDIIVLLLEHGANINISNKSGETPLLIAAHMMNYDAAKLLIDAGADVHVQNNEKQNIVSVVASGLYPYGVDVEKTKDFLSLFGPEYDVPDKTGKRPLDYLLSDSFRLVFWFIDRGFTADEDTYDFYFWKLVRNHNKTDVKRLFSDWAEMSQHFAIAAPDSEITGKVLVNDEKKALIICNDNVFTYIDPRYMKSVPETEQNVIIHCGKKREKWTWEEVKSD